MLTSLSRSRAINMAMVVPPENSARRLATVGAVSALSALNARSPVVDAISRRVLGLGAPVPQVLSMFAGMAATEIPLQLMAGEALAAAHLVRRGALRDGRGRVGLALTAASVVSLGARYREALQAPAVLERALRDGLGADYRERLPEDDYPGDVPLTRREIALPRLGPRRRYARTTDLSYGAFGRRTVLDIWSRADLPATAGAPVLVQVHGSGWVAGSKRGQCYPLLGHMAERGWVCVAINYRLSPAATWPAHIVDVKAAITWVRDNIAGFGGDPDFVALTGGSAGAQLASLAALTPNEPEFQPGFEQADTTVAAAVPFYGVYDFTNRDGTGDPLLRPFLERIVMRSRLADDRDRWERASPVTWAGPQAPPFFVIHGSNDTLTPVAQARSFVAALRAASCQPVIYAELPGAHHAFDLVRSVRTIHTVRAVDRFLSVVRAGTGTSVEAEGSRQAAAPAASTSRS